MMQIGIFMVTVFLLPFHSAAHGLIKLEEKPMESTTLIPEAWPPKGWISTAEAAPIPEIIEVTPEELAAFVSNTNFTESSPSPLFSSTLPRGDTSRLPERDIYGTDDRYLWTDTTTYPWSAIGRVQRQEGALCTGFLVGPRHAATARHCIRDGQWIRFAPGYYDGKVLGGAYVTQVFRSSTLLPGPGWTSCDFRDDYAILVLGNDRMGDRFGYFGARLVDDNMVNNAPFRHMGYPGDLASAERPYRIDDVRVHRAHDCDATGPLDTNSDMYGGQSGGPLWLSFSDGLYVLGLASASSAVESTFASGTNFVNHVMRARQDFP